MKPGDPEAIKSLFNDVADSYDLLNDVLSLGLHRVWKRELLNVMNYNVALYDWQFVNRCCVNSYGKQQKNHPQQTKQTQHRN